MSKQMNDYNEMSGTSINNPCYTLDICFAKVYINTLMARNTVTEVVLTNYKCRLRSDVKVSV